MTLNSSQLEAFFEVAKSLSFTKAAEGLHVTQSALSQRIAKLEEDLGTALFIRDRTSVRLTESGEMVRRFCQLNLSAESELLSKLKDSKDDLAGVLRVGAFSSIGRSLVIPSLKKLMTKNLRLSIQLLTGEIEGLPQLLRSGEADYIFSTRKSDSPNIENLFLGFEENVLVKLRRAPDIEIYLDHDENDPTTRAYFSQNKLNFKPLSMRYLDDVYGLIDGVKNGYGKAVLPVHLIEYENTLEIVDPKKTLKVPIYLQFFVQPFYRKVHSQFIEETSTFFKKELRQER